MKNEGVSAVTRHNVPVPFRQKSVNSYIAGRTVIDPGPDYPDARDALDSALMEHGLTPQDVERVVLSHAHVDHFGQAKRLRDLGANIVASKRASRMIENYEGYFSDRNKFLRTFLYRHGMPRQDISVILEDSRKYLDYATSVPVETRLDTDDTVEINDMAVRARETTGHAVGELLLLFESAGQQCAIVGDHVLETITPNPVLHHAYGLETNRLKMVVRYVHSLQRLQSQNLASLLPGHGNLIVDPEERIGELLEAISNRSRTVKNTVTEEMTAFRVMGEVFGELPISEYFGGMCEAIGHLEALEHTEQLRRVEKDQRIYYLPASKSTE